MSVTAPRGFRATGFWAGVKPAGELDLAIVDAGSPVVAAGVFTRSLTAAPPVLLSRRRIENGLARAIVINSGCANAGTGAAGDAAAERMAGAAAAELACAATDVLVCSTGPIGTQLPIERIERAMPAAVAALSAEGSHTAARAMMTTDSVPKEAVAAAGGFAIGAMGKGAGMVRPDMATMLAIVTTDAVVDASLARSSLMTAVESTFNRLNLDGCQSTNDSVVLLASGRSGTTPSLAAFTEALTAVCADLTAQMAADAEGASKVVRITVTGAGSDGDAARLGMAVADSALVRASFYGADPNWGRVFGALGVAGVQFDPARTEIAYQGVKVCSQGTAVPFDEAGLAEGLSGDFSLEISVGPGAGRATILTTDLTPDYVRFNGERS